MFLNQAEHTDKITILKTIFAGSSNTSQDERVSVQCRKVVVS